jgi:hypothetical protein
MMTNYVREAIAGTERQWFGALNFIRQKEEEAQVEAIINEERERLREEEFNAQASMKQTVMNHQSFNANLW